MYPPSFEYFAPTTLEETISLLERFGDEAKVLAGGQSLIPLLKLRFAAPRALVDINGVEGLDGLVEEDGDLRIGGRVRHRTCERSPLLRGRYQVLGDAAPQISDPLVRNLGTVGGSLAHADPQGDWGAVMLALDAGVEVQGPAGKRTIAIEEFLQGPFTTALEPTEVLTSVLVPKAGERSGGAYLKLERKVGDFASVAVAVHLELDGGVVRKAGIGLTAVGPTNLKAREAEQSLVGRRLDDEVIREAAELAVRAAEPKSDLRGSADYKRNLVRVFTEEGLRRAAALAGGRGPAAAAAPQGQAGGDEYFSGSESVQGVMDELSQKEGGPHE